MKSYIKTTIIATAAMALGMSVQASIFSASSSTGQWTGAPNVIGGHQSWSTGPAPTTGSGGTSHDNDSNWNSASAGGVNNLGAIAETFYLPFGGQLQSIQVVMGGAAADFNIELYDLGTLAAFQASSGMGGAYPAVSPNAQRIIFGNNLLTAGDSFHFSGSASDSLYTLTTDETINLLAGEVYAVSLDSQGGTASTFWTRGGLANSQYNTGMGWNTDWTSNALSYQDFEGKTGTLGTDGVNSGTRNMDLAINVVPEPAIMSLMGAGIALCGILFRRRKA